MQSPRQCRKCFGLVFAGSALLMVAIVGLFNYLIDPYAIFQAKTWAGVNVSKPRPDAMRQEIKAIVGERFRPDALILGNSRAEVGFDPRHPGFRNRQLRAFNAAVPGSGIDYSVAALQRFSESAEVRVAVVGLDFLDFLVSPSGLAETTTAPDGGSPSATKTRLLALFSSTALLDSLQTVRIQRQRDPATIRMDGFNPLLDYRAFAANDGYRVLFSQRAQEAARSLARQPRNLYVGSPGDSPAYRDLRRLLRIVRGKNTELRLVIYPYHLLLLLQFQEAGLWPLLDRWKADVTAIVDESRQTGVRVSLWDFACPHAIVAERVPEDGDRETAMHWFWEAGHFKKELGDLVLTRVLDARPPTAADDFGAQLAPETIEVRVSECDTAMTVMRQQFPRLAEDAALWARRAGARH